MQIGVTDTKPTLKASTFASRTSPSTDQSLQKSLLCQRREKLFLKNFLPFKKNKKRNAQPDTDRQITVAMQTPKPLTVKRFISRWTEGQLITAVWRNGGFSASYDSFVVGSSAVLRLHFCAENPPLRQAPKRYV
jgi:hypothetical protein